MVEWYSSHSGLIIMYYMEEGVGARFFLFFFCLALIGCRSHTSEVASKLLASIPEGSTICVTGFVDINKYGFNGVNKIDSESDRLCEELITALVEESAGKHSIIEQALAKKVIERINLEHTGHFDKKTIARLGEFLGAEFIITGTTYKDYVNARCLRVNDLRIFSAYKSYRW